jgi:hypothetical protein
MLINQLVKDDPALYFWALFRYYFKHNELVLSPELFNKKFTRT